MDSIERLALLVRKGLGISEDVKLDCLDLLRRLKWVKAIFDFRPGAPHELDGAAAKWIKESRTILISSIFWDELKNIENAEVRFTILHEIGHALLNHADRRRNFGGTKQHGQYIGPDEDEADRFALAISIPLNWAHTLNITDKSSLTRQFGLPEKQIELRMVDLHMHLRDQSPQTQAVLEEIELFDAETWLKGRMENNMTLNRSVPTKDEDWDF